MLVLFAVMALIVVITALGVVISRNPVYGALCLVANLLTVAGFFAMLDAHFLAAVQIIVYAGAIMVLFLFVIMLLNIKVEPIKGRGYAVEIFAWASGLVFAAVVARVFWGALKGFRGGQAEIAAASGSVEGTVEAIGKVLYTEYLFPFEAASVLLIAAIVGALMLAKRQRSSSDAIGPAKPVGR